MVAWLTTEVKWVLVILICEKNRCGGSLTDHLTSSSFCARPGVDETRGVHYTVTSPNQGGTAWHFILHSGTTYKISALCKVSKTTDEEALSHVYRLSTLNNGLGMKEQERHLIEWKTSSIDMKAFLTSPHAETMTQHLALRMNYCYLLLKKAVHC